MKKTKKNPDEINKDFYVFRNVWRAWRPEILRK